jgi:hypothetical protein
MLQSCTQAGRLFTAYMSPFKPLAHGLRVPLSDITYRVFLSMLHLRTEKDPVYGMLLSFFTLFKHVRIGISQNVNNFIITKTKGYD